LNISGARSLIFRGSKQTTVKERIIANQRQVQMLRIDREDTDEIDSLMTYDMFKSMSKNDYDMVIVSDYAKGLITEGVINFLKNEQKANIIVDPKPQHSNYYNGVYMITPNEKEWSEMRQFADITMKDVQFILETRGSKGMKLINCSTERVDKIEAEPVKIYNVSGCGDVVVATMATCLSMGLTPILSARIANKCAGYTATLPGTSIIPKEKFEELNHYKYLYN
jgi:rfaE bifunctional protein kinase chain/domain